MHELSKIGERRGCNVDGKGSDRPALPLRSDPANIMAEGKARGETHPERSSSVYTRGG